MTCNTALPLIQDANVTGKIVLVRADLNVPMDDKGHVTDTTRIEAVKPTLEYLRKEGAKVIICSHFGRPKGTANMDFSLKRIIKAIENVLEQPISFCEEIAGDNARDMARALNPGQLMLLENLRFDAGEEKNDVNFAKKLAQVAEIYVNDAFSVSHRAHASTSAVTELLPSFAGYSLQKEVESLTQTLETPKRPVLAVVGGAKISTKLQLLENLVKKVDYLVLGGAMANTFLLAEGKSVGESMVEPDMLDEARQIMSVAQEYNCRLVLPTDVLVAPELKENIDYWETSASSVKDKDRIFDLGPKTVKELKKMVTSEQIKTVLWNGPLGVFEVVPFDQATNQFAQFIGQQTKEGNLIAVAGGGDTVAALSHANALEMFSYVSTAGGAFLEWLEGKKLPGISALLKQGQGNGCCQGAAENSTTGCCSGQESCGS